MRNTQLQVRRGTSNQWFCTNPILLSGEPGLETDTLRYKIGDGTKAWNELEYVSFDGGNMDQSVIQPGSFQSGSGSFIVLSDYFDPTKPMNSYKGVTGNKMTVPSGFDHAIYIDSNGNVTQESVSAGQQLTFKSDIVTGKKTPYNCGKMDCGSMTGYNPETCKCCSSGHAWDGSWCSCIITDEDCQSISIPEATADPSTCSCTIQCPDPNDEICGGKCVKKCVSPLTRDLGCCCCVCENPPKCADNQFLNDNCECECRSAEANGCNSPKIQTGPDCKCECPNDCESNKILNNQCECECPGGYTTCGEDCCSNQNQDCCGGKCLQKCLSGLIRGENCDCICPAPNTPDCPCDYEYGTDANGCETIGCKECYPKMMANFKSTMEW